MNFIPYVIEKTANGERSYDIYSRLLQDRIVMVNGEVETNSMASVGAQLLYLNSIDKKKPIFMYINSPGGVCTDGLSVVGIMEHIEAPVYTICTGLAASMGSVLLSCGEKGHRYIMPYGDVMLHQASGGNQGNIQDMEISIKYTKELNDRLLGILARNCGKDLKQIKKDTARDFWLNAEAALKYGIVDHILKPDQSIVEV